MGLMMQHRANLSNDLSRRWWTAHHPGEPLPKRKKGEKYVPTEEWKAAGSPGMEQHECVGLCDAESGDAVIVPGLNRNLAVQAGVVRPGAAGGGGGQGGDGPPGGADAAGEPPKRDRRSGPSVFPTNVRGVVQGWNVPIFASVWGIFSLGVMRLRRPRTHEKYEFTPAGMALFIADVMEMFFRQYAPVLMGLSPQEAARPEHAERMRRFVDAILNLTPEQVEQIDKEARAEPEAPAAQ